MYSHGETKLYYGDVYPRAYILLTHNIYIYRHTHTFPRLCHCFIAAPTAAQAACQCAAGNAPTRLKQKMHPCLSHNAQQRQSAAGRRRTKVARRTGSVKKQTHTGRKSILPIGDSFVSVFLPSQPSCSPKPHIAPCYRWPVICSAWSASGGGLTAGCSGICANGAGLLAA